MDAIDRKAPPPNCRALTTETAALMREADALHERCRPACSPSSFKTGCTRSQARAAEAARRATVRPMSAAIAWAAELMRGCRSATHCRQLYSLDGLGNGYGTRMYRILGTRSRFVRKMTGNHMRSHGIGT